MPLFHPGAGPPAAEGGPVPDGEKRKSPKGAQRLGMGPRRRVQGAPKRPPHSQGRLRTTMPRQRFLPWRASS